MTVQGCKYLLTIRHNKKRDQYQMIAPAYLYGAHHEDVTRIMNEKQICCFESLSFNDA